MNLKTASLAGNKFACCARMIKITKSANHAKAHLVSSNGLERRYTTCSEMQPFHVYITAERCIYLWIIQNNIFRKIAKNVFTNAIKDVVTYYEPSKSRIIQLNVIVRFKIVKSVEVLMKQASMMITNVLGMFQIFFVKLWALTHQRLPFRRLITGLKTSQQSQLQLRIRTYVKIRMVFSCINKRK